MIFFGTTNQNYIDTIKLARQAIESTYDCECNIIEQQAIENPVNKRTEYKEITVLEKQPCRISYKTISTYFFLFFLFFFFFVFAIFYFFFF